MLLLTVLSFIGAALVEGSLPGDGYLHEPGRCVMKHQCGVSTAPGGGFYDCANNSLAEPVPNEEFYSLLSATCPMLIEPGNATTVCCDIAMLSTLSESLTVPYSLLNGCPSCLQNFLSVFCAITCGKDQSMFAYVVKTQPYTPPPHSGIFETASITEIAYLLNSTFTNAYYESCSNVQLSESNSKVIGTLCGTSAASCTPAKLLAFMGSIDNDQAPFQIDMYIDFQPASQSYPNTSFAGVNLSSMNYPTYACSDQIPSLGYGQCSCQDCPVVCIPQPPAAPSHPCTVGSLNCPTFFSLLFYVIFFVATLSIVIWLRRSFHESSAEVEERTKLLPEGHKRDYDGAFRVGKVEAFLRTFFTLWGRICGDRPGTVIIVSLVFTGCLCIGIIKFNVTTDPVELWSSPTSTSRLQMDTYDNAFGPFYRTTQVIITAPDLPGEMYQAWDNTGYEYNYVHFSGMFRYDVLLSLLEFQNQIMALTAEYNGTTVTLADICLRPLCNDTDTTRDSTCGIANCTIFSPLNWFQNSPSQLSKQACATLGGASQSVCGQLAPSFTTPESVSTAPNIVGPICGMALPNGVCDCGCGNCPSDPAYCCTCPPKDSYLAQYTPIYDYHDHILQCTMDDQSISDVRPGVIDLGSCLGTYGGPIFPNVALGGYDCYTADNSTICNYPNASAIIITIPIDNHVDESLNGPAEAWESVFLDFMQNYQSPIFVVAYSAERSTSDELAKSSAASELTVIISYLLMFLYVSVTLGSFPTKEERSSGKFLQHTFVRSRLLLGLAGVIIVLMSVAASLGFWSALGFSATLIVVEVVPFLTLAVGVDNIFIMTHSFEETYQSGRDVTSRLSMVMGEVGPSLFLCSISETVAFAIGAMSGMPAVRTFALFACGAVFIDFLLQITVFASLLAIDARRSENSRCDCFPCVQFEELPPQPHSPSMIQGAAKWLADKIIRPIPSLICFLFSVLMFSFGLILTFNISVGLNQQLAFPTGSYINNYFDAINDYLEVGAPVYYVVSGVNYSVIDQQNLVCGGHPNCSQSSIVSAAYLASGDPSSSRVALPVSSWLDDYVDWLQSSSSTSCCMTFNQNYTTKTANYSVGDFCSANLIAQDERSKICDPCPGTNTTARLGGEVFEEYLGFFLRDVPNVKCAKAGHAAYGSAVLTEGDLSSPQASPLQVDMSYFMTYHTKCVTSGDFTNALAQARDLCDKVSSSTGVTVFPYSVFYVFYEQYLTIVSDTILGLGVSLGAILVITSFLLGSFWAGAIIMLTIAMVIIDMMGVMALWGIDLNAISLVNLIMAIGISVEFVAHITRAFCIGTGSRRQRAHHALSKMGSNVISGIMCTKFAGIIVLAFSVVQIFEVFYFRMYLLMVIFGAFHGLIFLPAALALIGPPERKPTAVDPKHERRHISVNDPRDINGTVGTLPRRVQPTLSTGSYGTLA